MTNRCVLTHTHTDRQNECGDETRLPICNKKERMSICSCLLNWKRESLKSLPERHVTHSLSHCLRLFFPPSSPILSIFPSFQFSFVSFCRSLCWSSTAAESVVGNNFSLPQRLPCFAASFFFSHFRLTRLFPAQQLLLLLHQRSQEHDNDIFSLFPHSLTHLHWEWCLSREQKSGTSTGNAVVFLLLLHRHSFFTMGLEFFFPA